LTKCRRDVRLEPGFIVGPFAPFGFLAPSLFADRQGHKPLDIPFASP
jgi:hypothetical protein